MSFLLSKDLSLYGDFIEIINESSNHFLIKQIVCFLSNAYVIYIHVDIYKAPDRIAALPVLV